MPKQCCAGGIMRCSFGICPVPLNVLPVNGVFTGTPAANIMDNKPFLNIPTFATCSSPLNPLVIANFGFPAPCIPNIITPWFIGAIGVAVANIPALNEQSKCMCAYGGIVSFAFAGQITADVG